MHQTYPKNMYEVIIVNDGSADKTAHIVSEVARKNKNVHLITLKDVTPGYSPKKFALHTGVMNSRGDIILSTDADCRVKSTWIETMVSYFSPNVGMVVGFSQLGRKREKHSFFEKLQAFDFLQLMAAAAGSSSIGYPLAASGQNMGYRREVYRQVGGYDKVAHRISGDDVLLLQLVRGSTNWRIVFAYSVQAFNSSQPQKTLRGLVNQRTRWASNASYQVRLNKLFFAYLVAVFALNFALLLGMLIAVFTYNLNAGIFCCFLVKACAELLIALKAARIFNRLDLIKYFPTWVFLQTPYVVFSGLLGIFWKFNWKDREHKAEAEAKAKVKR